MAKVILHADLNNFYASVACLHRPDLREVPLAVCGDPARRHGIVLAKNMPAKRYGIQTGQVLWQAFQLCPRLTTIAPDYREVSRMSQTVRTIFGRYTDRVQPFGIDEAWLDLTAPDMTLEQGERIANHLRHTVREETGLTVSVGVSDSRVLAKLGSDLKKPDAVSLICEQNRSQVLDPLPIGSLLFVGRATARKLNAIGIYTVGQLAAADPQVLRGVLGKAGLTLSGFARGADDARGRWCGLLVGLLAAPLLLLGAYYPLRYGFGVHGLWLDLLLYVLAMGAGFLLAYRLRRRALPGWLCGPLVIAAGIYGAALALFSFAPPDLPIFRP